MLSKFRKRLSKAVARETVKQLVPRQVQGLERILDEDCKNIERARQRRALAETVSYIEENMTQVQSVGSKFELIDTALAQVPENAGHYLEFGVFSGETINYISAKVSAVIHGFDSFEGLPEAWRDGYDQGYFKCELPKVNENVRLHKGFFEASLQPWLASNRGDIRFVHVDCDLYSSTRQVLELLGERLCEGAVIIFDEYFNYPGWQRGEFQAFKEFIHNSGRSYSYLGYNRYHEQVAIQLDR